MTEKKTPEELDRILKNLRNPTIIVSVDATECDRRERRRVPRLMSKIAQKWDRAQWVTFNFSDGESPAHEKAADFCVQLLPAGVRVSAVKVSEIAFSASEGGEK